MQNLQKISDCKKKANMILTLIMIISYYYFVLCVRIIQKIYISTTMSQSRMFATTQERLKKVC